MLGTSFGGPNRRLVVQEEEDDDDVATEISFQKENGAFTWKSVAHTFFETLAEATSENRLDCTPRGPSSRRRTNGMEEEDDDDNQDEKDTDERRQDNRPPPAPQKKDLEEAELSWRLHPDRSMSDWTIQVTTKGTNRWKNYHVHRSVLAVGPRKSDFFVDIFQKADQYERQYGRRFAAQDHSGGRGKKGWCKMGGGPINEAPLHSQQQALRSNQPSSSLRKASATVTKLELESLAADIFPFVLDFMYDTSGFVNMNSGNATAYHVLAHRLKINALKRRAMEFWQTDLNVQNLATYCIHGHIFRDESILRACEPLVAHHMFTLQESDRAVILESIDPKFFISVMQFALKPIKAKSRKSFSLKLSSLVAVYCNLHKATLTAKHFQTMTDEGFLPYIEVEAAKSFIELQDAICGPTNQVSSLTLRCITVLSGIWDKEFVSEELLRVSNDDNDTILDILSGGGRQVLSLPGLSGAAMNAFVSATLVNAKKRILKLEAELAVLKKAEQERKQVVVQHLPTSPMSVRHTPSSKLKSSSKHKQRTTPDTLNSSGNSSVNNQLDVSDEKFFAEIEGMPADFSASHDFATFERNLSQSFQQSEDGQHPFVELTYHQDIPMVKKKFRQSYEEGIQVAASPRRRDLGGLKKSKLNMFRKTKA